jgi:hypothetical protein
VQSVAFHDRFVQAFSAGAAAYERTEVANASPLQAVESDVMGVVNMPTEVLMERPLIGDEDWDFSSRLVTRRSPRVKPASPSC